MTTIDTHFQFYLCKIIIITMFFTSNSGNYGEKREESPPKLGGFGGKNKQSVKKDKLMTNNQ